jgi:hypothetical protein
VTSGVKVSSRISHLVQRPDFDLARSRHGIGAALHPGERLIQVLDFPEPEAGDQLAGLGERPVADGTAGTIERNTLGFSEADIVLQIFQPAEAQGANGRFQVRDRDGAMNMM